MCRSVASLETSPLLRLLAEPSFPRESSRRSPDNDLLFRIGACSSHMARIRRLKIKTPPKASGGACFERLHSEQSFRTSSDESLKAPRRLSARLPGPAINWVTPDAGSDYITCCLSHRNANTTRLQVQASVSAPRYGIPPAIGGHLESLRNSQK